MLESEPEVEPVELDQAWKTWIWTNINRGCSKQEMFERLWDRGFDRSEVIDELNYDPDDAFLVAPARPRAKPGPAGAYPVVEIPIAARVDASSVELYTIEDFLNTDECGKLVELIRHRCVPSALSSYEPDETFRTSRTCALSHYEDPFVAMINERICKAIGINPSYGEGLQGQFYRPGEEFKPHTDYFSDREWASHCALQGQRTWTFMVFLNEVEAGGATRFPNLDIDFQPRRGRCVIWNNLGAAGEPNPDTLHHGTPVETGEKFILTKWFRQRGEGVMVTRDPKEACPRYTARGFQRMAIPEALHRPLVDYYRAHREGGTQEHVEGGFITGPDRHSNSRLIDLPDDLKHLANEILHPILEEWSGVRLEPTFVYGVREYAQGARLWPHRDRADTHAVSATLTIDQDGDESWPFEIDDHVYRRHEVSMQSGEMALYESLTLLHGRTQPLQGRWHADVFVHYQPIPA